VSSAVVEPREKVAQRKAILRRLHDLSLARLLPHNLVSFFWLALVAAAIWTWFEGYWPLTLLCWLVGSHVGHMKLAMFHEASHGTLYPTWWRNDMQGMIVGTVNLIPLSVYRMAHWQHHAYLATERDPELWPFTMVGTPRWARVLSAIAEIVLGFIYTPILYVRAALKAPSIPPAVQRRIWIEYALCLLTWGTILGLVAYNGWWEAFIVGYAVQMVLTGAMQTINKYTEHLGLLGDTALTSTRTVVDEDFPGRALSRSMLNLDYHGTHHRYAKVPYYYLPEATPHIYTGEEPAVPLYANYWLAMWDMLKCLGDPKVGRQWVS
jgi:fatty acid desaturase